MERDPGAVVVEVRAHLVAGLSPGALGAPLAASESALPRIEGGASEHVRAVPTAGGLEMGTVAGGSQPLFADELAAAVVGGQAAQQALTAWEAQQVRQKKTKWVELAQHVARRCGCKVSRRRDGRFVVHETRDGESYPLGTFDTARAAALAIVVEARENDEGAKVELTAEEAVLLAEVEGLELVRSATSRSGYKGVYVIGGRFQADVRRDGRLVHLGNFGSAEAAALAYARDAREHGVEAREQVAPRAAGQDLTAEEAVAQAAAEGLELVRSTTSRSGYRGVHVHRSHFEARLRRGGKQVHLGHFDTAEAAALAYARDAREHNAEAKEEAALRAAGQQRSAEEAVRQASAEGLELVRSARTNSGYKGVTAKPCGRLKAEVWRGGRLVHLGDFGSAEAAALAYARGAREHGVEWMNSEGERLEVTAEDAGAHAAWPDGVLVCEAQSVDV